ncbi:hypothetical protein Tco_1109580 [Tanacetum coccineum]
MLTSKLKVNPQSRALWLSGLSAAFRTATACCIVAVATLFGPEAFRRQVAFPAFSYVTVILIITGASLGDTFRGCWDALCATALTVIPAILGLAYLGPARLTTALTAVIVGMAAFVVMLPDQKTHLVSKRIALGQIVIIYVVAYDKGGETDPFMHPVHVAASTAVGVLACVVSLLLPYPGLATCQVKKKCKLYADNASERVKLFVKAFCAQDYTSEQAFVSQAKSLFISGTKLLNAIKSKKAIPIVIVDMTNDDFQVVVNKRNVVKQVLLLIVVVLMSVSQVCLATYQSEGFDHENYTRSVGNPNLVSYDLESGEEVEVVFDETTNLLSSSTTGANTYMALDVFKT